MANNPYLDLIEQGQSANADAGGNPYLDIVNGETARADATFKASATVAIDANPDEVARQKRVAKLLQVPPAAVEALPEETQRQAKLQQIDQDTRGTVALRTAMANPEFAKLAHDDTENLSLLEKGLRTFGSYVLRPFGGEMVGRTEQGLFGAAAAVADVAAAAVDPLVGRILPTNPIAPVAGQLQEFSNQGKLWADTYGIGAHPDEYSSMIGQAAASGIASAAQNVLTMGLGLRAQGVGMAAEVVSTTPTLSALAPMGAITAGQAYTDAKDSGLGLPQRLAFAGLQGGVEMVTEALPFGRLLEDIKAGSPFLVTLGKQLVTENIGEQAATHWQDANEWLFLHPDKSLKDYLDERPNAALQTLIATTVATGLQTGGFHLATQVADSRRAQNAEAQAKGIEELNKLAAASKVIKRDADSVQQFVESAVAEGADSLYIGARELMQTGVGEAVARLSPTAGQQVEEALATGGTVRIPLAEYTAHIAGTEYAQPLVDHLKVDPEGFSRAEAREYLQTQGDQLKAEVEQTLAKAQVSDEFRTSLDTLKQQVLDNLNQAGRFSEQTNEIYAQLIASRTAVRAAQLGMTPEQLFAKDLQALQVRAEQVGGNRVLNQEPGQLPEVVAGIEAGGVAMDAFEKDGIITLSRIVVPKDARGQGAGTAAMQALVDYADATGQHIALSPSSDFGGNKNRLVQFYKRFGFLENKGKNRAFTTRESMVRRAPGKDLFQASGEGDGTNGVAGGNATGVGYANGQQILESRLVQLRSGTGNDGRGGISLVPEEWAKSSAYSAVRFGEGSFLQEESSAATVRAESDRLIAAAKQHGFFWGNDSPVFDFLANTVKAADAGAEHDAYFAGEPQNRVVLRSTANGTYGPTKDTSPAQYLHRLEEYNQVFPDLQIRMIGVSQDEDGKAVIWTAQRFVKGEEFATEAELEAAMAAHGWEQEGVSYRYRNKATGAVIQDAHTGNVLHIGDELFPIDVIVEKLPKGREYNQDGQQGPRLSAIHNLSAENLAFADKMGGIAVPSIGVVTAEAGGVDGFGEITLIGTRDIADPRAEPVFSSDAYTARFPKPEWNKVKRQAADKLVAEIRPIADEFDDRMVTSETFDGMVNNPDAGEVISRWLGSNAIQAMFLREKGVDAVPVMREANFDTGLTKEQIAELEGDYQAVVAEWRQGNRDAPIIETVRQKVRDMVEVNAKAEGLNGKMLEEYLDAVADGFPRNLFNDRAKVNNGFGVDSWKTREALRPEIEARAAEFKAWVEAKVLPPFGDPFLKVGRQKRPYTLPNIVEVMTDPKVKGQEKTMTYGAGQVRAASSQQFNDIEEMRAAAATAIADPAEYEKAKKESEAALEAYRDAVIPYTTLTNWRGEPDTWEALDASMRALAKWATGKKRDAAGLRAALRKEGFKVDSLPAGTIEQGVAAGEALLNAPVPYFEAKPQRAVSLDEFAGAVIPANALPEARAILDKHGIPYREVAEGADRQATVREFTRELDAQGAGTLFQDKNSQARGSFNPDTTVMTLLKNANLSTFLHEAGHYFFEADIALASELVADGRTFGEGTHTEGERKLLEDVSALLRWHGIRGSLEEQLRQWHTMDFEEKRSHHERTAESFEAYLFEGKAPSIELQPYFQKFRAWLTAVYKSLKDFLGMRPEAGKLNDEVRAIFDRMLATDEQIVLAQQGRSMQAMFRTEADATAVGMTPEEFVKYQAMSGEAAADAAQDLQAKALRDLQWTRNARNREIKKLQRKSAETRREVRMAVRREVMSQPVYRAWQFLTAKITADDKVTAEGLPKSAKDTVTPEVDSLFVAIAKLGGLQKADVADSWGVTDAVKAPVFGKPVLRANGGYSVDAMAEKLGELGYLTLDRDGKVDVREFEELFGDELRGAKRYSNLVDGRVQRADQAMPGEGIDPNAVQAGRLDRASLEEIGLPAEIIGHLEAMRMVAKTGGWHPDLIAERFGFQSGDELARTLAAAEAPQVEIEGLTDARMLAEFGELATPAAIEREADKAIHNEARARMVATEANALAKATGQRKVLVEAAKQFADTMIARLKVRDVRPGQYTNAATRAGKLADKAMREGNLVTAAAEKRNQLVNTLAARAAMDAREEIDGALKKLSEFARRADDKLVKSYDMDMVNAVRAILGQYGIAEGKAKKAAEYLKAVEAYDPELYGILRESVDAAEASAKPVKDMTVEEVRGLRDEIEAILHLARRSREMEVGGDKLDRAEVEDALREQLELLGIPGTVPGEGQAVTPAEARMAQFKAFIAAATRMENWTERMDAGKPMGPFKRFVYSVVKDAADAYRTDKAARLKQFRALVEAIAPTLKPQVIAAPELGYTFGKDSGGSAMNEILHALLHTGNESNKRKLLLGRGWATEGADGVVNTSRWDAFVARLVAEGKLTPEHYDFVQGVWDLLESTKPLAQKTHRDVFGKYFDEVTAQAFVDPFGTTRAGGYVPAMVDTRVVKEGELRALAEMDNSSLAYAFPTTAKGFTKSRVEYNRPLMLDLRTLAQHIDKVLLFSHMEMPVRDVQRVLSGKVGSGINRIDPAATSGLIVPWLNRAAKQQVEAPIAGSAGLMRFFSVMRARAGAAAMFGNLANAVQQVAGFSMAAVKVKPSLLGEAMASYIKDPKGITLAVRDASPYMAGRMENEVSTMTEAINDILLNPNLIERGQAWTMRHAYFLQSAIDNVMSPVIWTGAYNQYVADGYSHEDAVRLADGVVRTTQGSTMPEDISRIEGGNAFVRLFTQFAGYFNMQANLLGTEFANVMHNYGLRKGAGRGLYVFTMGFLVNAIVAETIMQLFRGGPGDEDKDGSYIDDWLAAVLGWAPLRNATAMVPVLGQGVNSMVNAWNGKPYDDRLATSPAISMLESAAKAPVSVYNAVAEGGSPQKAVRDVATLISMTVGLPANLAARPVGYGAGVVAGDITPSGPVDAARGLLTGTASK